MPKSYKDYKSILLIRSNAVSDFRMEFAARALSEAGYDTELISEVPFYKAGQYDLFICCRPGDSMIGFLNTVADTGKPIIVDIDDDFNSIPRHNPAYGMMGPGNPNYLLHLDRLLHREHILTTFAMAELQHRYHVDGVVVANAWDNHNKNWFLPKYKRKTINIGFSGTPTHREDFNLAEAAIKQVMSEFPQTVFVCNVDDQIYGRFGSFPESRRLFLPGVFYEHYPLVFRYIDILTVPLRDTHFNRAKSDIKMIECGASSTFFVASSLPFYNEWGVGGFMVDEHEKPEKTTADWYDALKGAVTDAECRRELVDMGHEKAMTRTADDFGKKWVAIVNQMLGREMK